MKAKLKNFKPVLTVVLVVIILGLFGWYIAAHRYLLTDLAQTSWTTVVSVIVLYFVFFISLMVILDATLNVCRMKPLRPFENFALNAYSKLANFFIPGQSGPFLRGAYLKKKHKLPVKKYVFGTLAYYACYALVSVFMLLAFSVPWWLTVLGILAVGTVCWFVVRLYERKKKLDENGMNFTLPALGYLLLATVFQAIVQIAIYFVELHSLRPDVGVGQAITYTGAANFGLFVALTPGAIGIREAFLFFSQQLHHISGNTIIAAGIIDRGSFLIYLGLLFLALLAFHGRKKFGISRPKKEVQPH
jgi:uncharacterized membrane protein YbhN (UPF0104 family)